MRRTNFRDSRARFGAEGSPQLHFPSGNIHSIKLRSPLIGFAGGRIHRFPIQRPIRHVVAGVQSRDETNTVPTERPNSPFSIGSQYRRALPVRREVYSSDALGSNGLGIAATQIDHIVTRTVSGLNPRNQQVFPVWQPAARSVTYGVVRKLSCLAGSGGNQT